MIRAFAGCGKTTTLDLIDQALKVNPKLLLCFNKKLATEAAVRLQPSTTCRTFNSLGHGIWKTACSRNLTLSPTKILDIYRTLAEEAPRGERAELWANYDTVSQGVNLARAIGYIPATHAKADKSIASASTLHRMLDETPSPEAVALIDKVLNISIAQSYNGTIDFNDQLYMPALFAGSYPQFPVVLVDEYQDLSPINRMMVSKLCKNSRQIGVGDEAQAIYGFRGADQDSMSVAIAKFSMEVLPLSLTFRCPSKIVQNVHWRVPEFRASRDGGIVERLSGDWSVADNSAVICRNNAPLLKLAMKLLVAGRRVDLGGVDIGSRVIKQLSKLGPESFTQAQTLSAISDWQAEKESVDSKTAADTADCMRVFARQGKTLGDALTYARHLFALKGEIQLMTGHKAKGLEFDHVYHLDHDLLKPHGQDTNLHYVIDSRPKERLSYIQST
jgi:superfamily I DNA/RNA helicase